MPIMNFQARLQALRTEYQSGQDALKALREQQAELEKTMLRIAGAIQVLEEVEAAEKQTPDDQEQ
jgi:prefoldin subunit 5